MKFVFTDGEKIGVYQNGKAVRYDSAHLTAYKENAMKTEKNRAWKKKTDAMIEDGFVFGEDEGQVRAELRGVSLTTDENKLLYAFTVNETSGIYYKYLDDEKLTEAHAISSNEVDFVGVSANTEGDVVGTVRVGLDTSSIALFTRDCGEYKLLTGGDSLDENPFIDGDKNILFNSYGIGRGANNEFLTYLPSEILKFNVRTLDIEIVMASGKYSFVKPTLDKDGNLYCIRKPDAERKKENIFLQILLIPVRIVEAIIGFISAFVAIFAGKPMISGGGNGGFGGKVKNGKDRGQVFIHNQFINVDKELKRNKKSDEGGFIPRDWTLVKCEKTADGYAVKEELALGVADYCVIEENGETALLYTNGKRIFEIKNQDGKYVKNKLVHTDFCLHVSALTPRPEGDSPFSENDGDLFWRI